MLSEARKEKAIAAEIGIKPIFHKGITGSNHDYYTCGNCGKPFYDGVCDNYCRNCGYRILWDSTRCLTK